MIKTFCLSILLLLIFTIKIHAKILHYNQIDIKNTTIQIGSGESLTDLENIFKDIQESYNLVYRNYKNKFFIAYIVNIKKENEKNTLHTIQKKYPSAFITNQLNIYLTEILNYDFLLRNAITTYNNKQYQKSYAEFFHYSANSVLTKRETFLYARSAYEIKKYTKALSLYEQILLEDPSNVRTQLEIAQTYLKMENYQKAKGWFSKVLEEKLPNNVRKNILNTLQLVETKNKKHIFQAMAILELLYDTNIDNNADAGEYSIYIDGLGDTTLSNEGEKNSDSIVQLIVLLNHIYKFTNDVTLENRLVILSQSYNEHSDKNIDFISLQVEPSYYQDNYSLSSSLSYNYVFLGGTEYLQSISVSPTIRYQLTKNLNYTTSITLNKKEYFQDEDTDLNSYSYQFLNNISFQTKEYGLNTLSIELGRDKREKGSRSDVNKDYYSIDFTNSYPLLKTLALSSGISYKKIAYKDIDANFLTSRKDIHTIYSLGLQNIFSRNISAKINLQYIDNYSNHDPFEYNKYILKASFYYRF